jgi:carbonic anhydrase/acetyltransferase-like protein (isoleucine patch superfamily)
LKILHLFIMRKLLSLLLLFGAVLLYGQKEIYIPLEWQQGAFDYSFDRAAESDNFIMFWGPLAGTDPTTAPAEIAFNPEDILITAESLYRFYIDTLHFIPSDSGLITKWKMIIVLLHTWDGLEGWAFGGNYDGQTGAMWMHPKAAESGSTLAHEFTHALQNYTWMMYPGHGFINHSYVGFFWEAHAEFMAMQRFPEVARYFDISRWMNTAQYHWSSTRHHYQAFLFLQYIKEKHGLELINRMWRESVIGEHPLQTLMRLLEIDQVTLNDMFADYASMNVTWDYLEIGHLLKDADAALPEVFQLNKRIIPDLSDTDTGHYKIQNHRAPQDYGYNIIRLIPEIPDSCDRQLIFLKFKGIVDVNPDAGWRYRFVAINDLGIPRYSAIFSENEEEVSFELEETDEDLYLVVIGAPKIHHNYAWEVGFPKIYRYPYEFRLVNAIPDGHQAGFSLSAEEVDGSLHPNGGGFVATTAFASPSAYIGPNARVLDYARVENNARIEDYAVIKHHAVVRDNALAKNYAIIGENALIREDAIVSGHARIWGGNEASGTCLIKDHVAIFGTRVFEQAELGGNTFCWGATLHGDVKLGGDAEYFSTCNRGTYLQVQGAYGRECDGLVDHPANIEVNNPGTPIDPLAMVFNQSLNCDIILNTEYLSQENQIYAYPNPSGGLLNLVLPSKYQLSNIEWSLLSAEGKTVKSGRCDTIPESQLNISDVPDGFYILIIIHPETNFSLKLIKRAN